MRDMSINSRSSSTPRSPSLRLVGYARVSSNAQELQLQLDALQKAGCTKGDIFTDKVSGAKSERPGLDRCLQQLKAGDVLVVWRLDRLGRSMRHLIDLVEELRQRGIGFRSLSESVDTTSANGKLTFHIFTALAEFERDLIRERTKAGLAAARARDRNGGRKPIPASDPRVQMAKKMHGDRTIPVMDICQTLRISRPTLYRYVSLK